VTEQFSCQSESQDYFIIVACVKTYSNVIFPDKLHVQLKRPRIVPGEEVDEKSKKVGYQLFL